MAPTTEMSNIVRMASQVFVQGDCYGFILSPARFKKTVIQDQTNDAPSLGDGANDGIAQMPIRRGQGLRIRMGRTHAGKFAVESLPYPLFSQMRNIPDKAQFCHMPQQGNPR